MKQKYTTHSKKKEKKEKINKNNKYKTRDKRSTIIIINNSNKPAKKQHCECKLFKYKLTYG